MKSNWEKTTTYFKLVLQGTLSFTLIPAKIKFTASLRKTEIETHYLQYGGALLLSTWKWMSEPLCVLSAWPQFKPSKISCVLQRRCQGPHPRIPTVIELWIRVGLQEMHVWDLEGEWENTLFSWGSGSRIHGRRCFAKASWWDHENKWTSLLQRELVRVSHRLENHNRLWISSRKAFDWDLHIPSPISTSPELLTSV